MALALNSGVLAAPLPLLQSLVKAMFTFLRVELSPTAFAMVDHEEPALPLPSAAAPAAPVPVVESLDAPAPAAEPEVIFIVTSILLFVG